MKSLVASWLNFLIDNLHVVFVFILYPLGLLQRCSFFGECLMFSFLHKEICGCSRVGYCWIFVIYCVNQVIVNINAVHWIFIFIIPYLLFLICLTTSNCVLVCLQDLMSFEFFGACLRIVYQTHFILTRPV